MTIIRISIVITFSLLVMSDRFSKDSVEITTFAEKPAAIKESVVMRSKPSATAEKVECATLDYPRNHDCDCRSKASYLPDCGCNDGGCLCSAKRFTTLEPGKTVQIVGKSANKVQVGKWHNYWYKLKTETHLSNITQTGKVHYLNGIPCQSGEIWLFGEFLDIGETRN